MSSAASLRIVGHVALLATALAALLGLAAWGLETESAVADVAFSLGVILTALLHAYVLSGGGRSLRTARAFMRRGWQVFLSYRFQVVLVLVQLGVFAALIILLGGPLVEALFAPVGGALSAYTQTNYLVFLLLGLAFFPILWSSYEVSAARIRQEQMAGLFETLVATPAGVRSLPFAFLASSFISSIVSVLAVLLVFSSMLPDGALRVTDPSAVAAFAAILVLAGVTMWGLGLVMGGLTTVFKQAQSASSLLRMLLLIFGGVYIPPALLPEWGQWLARALPITYAGEGVRAALADGARAVDLLPQLGALAAFALVTTVAGMRLYRALLDRARRAGTLYGY